MKILARRFIVVTLLSATFAVLFAALAVQPKYREARHGSLVGANCSSSFDCRVSL